DPSAAAANRMSSVAGGHTSKSTAVSARAPWTIRLSSATEERRPFIFQFPATSGRGRAIFVPGFPRLALRLPEHPQPHQRPPCDGLPPPPPAICCDAESPSL